MPQKDIGLFHPWIHSRGGVEKTILEILEKSEHNITLYTAVYRPEQTFDEFEKYNIKTIGKLPIKGYLFRGLSFSLMLFSKKLPQHDKLVISTAGVAEFLNFRNKNQELIGYCHTPLKAAHDTHTVNQNLERMKFPITPLYQTAIKAYKIIEKQAWKHFNHVQFNSQTTLQRALKAELITKDKTSINYPGANTQHNKPGKQQKYFLYPSRFVPYKRQEKAIDAYKQFKKQNPNTEFKLILAGATQEEKKTYTNKIKKQASKTDGVELKTNLPEKKWEQLFRNCYAVLFTSANEDWGIVPIEAMSYGKPIIAINRGGPSESILHQETGLLVKDNTEHIAEAMNNLAENPEKTEKMRAKAIERSKKYSWKNFVKKFDETLSE